MTIFSLCPHMAEGAGELSGGCFIRTPILLMKVPPPLPNSIPSSSHWGLGCQHTNLGMMHVQSIKITFHRGLRAITRNQASQVFACPELSAEPGYTLPHMVMQVSVSTRYHSKVLTAPQELCIRVMLPMHTAGVT